MNDRDKTMPSAATPTPSAADVQRRIASELGLPSRLGHTALLLAGLLGAGVAGALLLTETGLPVRTRIAFAVLVVIGLAWAVFSVWVLKRRRVLFASHRVAAGRMAVTFTAVFTLGMLILGLSGDAGRVWVGGVGVGVALLSLAVVQLLRARRQFNALSRRRAELERQLAGAQGRS